MRLVVDCLVLGARPSGVERAVSGLLRGLAESDTPDIDMTAIVGAGADRAQLPDAGISIRHAPGPTRGRASRILYEQLLLPALARSHGADVVHGAAYVLPLTWRDASVVTIHDTITLTHPQWCKPSNVLHYREVMTASARSANIVATPSAEARAAVIEHLAVEPSRVWVAPLGVGEEFAPSGEDAVAALRERHNLTQPYLLCVGNIEPRKNLPAVIEAFEAVAGRLPHDLVLAGKAGWRCAPILEAMKTSPVAERIRWLDYVADADLPALYTGADLLVQWSLHEGFGLAPLEAMACGTRALVSDAGALPEVAGEAARIVPLADGPEGLGQALVAMACDESPAAELIARGRERAAQFTWARHAEAMLAIYREAAGGQT